MIAILGPGYKGDEFNAGLNGEAIVIGVKRLEYNYFIAGLADDGHCEDYCFGAAGGNDNVGGVDV